MRAAVRAAVSLQGGARAVDPADAVDRVAVPVQALEADLADRVVRADRVAAEADRVAAEADQGGGKVTGVADPVADPVAVLLVGPAVAVRVAVIREMATPAMAAVRRRAVVGAAGLVVAELPVVAGVVPAVPDQAVPGRAVRGRAVRGRAVEGRAERAVVRVAGEAGAVPPVVAARAVVSPAELALPWI